MASIGNIKAAVVQRVGNKSNDDGVAFSDSLCQMDGVEEHLLTLINASFRFDDWKQFYYIDELEMNPTYRFVSKIFDDENCLVKQANNLARHLYEQSIHPNIKIGEFYVVLLEGCEIDGEETKWLCSIFTVRTVSITSDLNKPTALVSSPSISQPSNNTT